MSKPVCLIILYDGKEHAKQQPKLLGAAENALGLREFIESHGYEVIATSDKEGENSEFERNLERAEIIITTPFWPGYVTKERMAKAPNLKICITAGVGSDHISLDTANERGISVVEVTGSNVQSVAEHVIMTMLILIRNYNEGHYQALSGGWDVAAVAKNEWDIEGKVISTIGAGRIGYRVLERLVAFNPKKLYYYDYQDLPAEAVKKINDASRLFNGVDNILERKESLEDIARESDIITINCPLYEGTRGLWNEKYISLMKPGAFLVNTARGAICNENDVAKAVNAGHIQYGGDVWPVQPARKDAPWRSMHYPISSGDSENLDTSRGYSSDGAFVGNAMTIHCSGTSLDAQARYSAGVKDILTEFFNKTYNYRPQDIICIDGDYYTKAYGQRTKK
ncbi:unnamed protein product [Candida verbasci]|uniref:Formate dehydrogenase n=1 Tax=Candida verbasci TaxID=1227364 RepID=A0A9W4TRY0_9ASCO|nr:unnamed protein product [Candida verbasci]